MGTDTTTTMASTENYFNAIDYVIFGTMLTVSAGIGIVYGIRSRKEGSYMASDYLVAGRTMSFGPVSLSLIASFMSSVTILGVPAEYYVYGTMFSWYGLVYIFLPFIIIGIFIPVFYDLGISSAYEYLEKRFNRATRLAATCFYLILSMLYGGIVTYGPALALSKVTGLNLWGSILCTGAVCIFYTVLGGLKAVIWADVLQSVLMMSGFFVVIIKGSMNLGGFSKIWMHALDGGRIDFVHFELDPRIRHTFWAIILGGTILWTSIFGVNQSQVQRYISCKTKRHANISVIIAGCGLVVILILAGMTGLTIYATYKDCDPLKHGLLDKPDQLFPYIIMDIAGNLHGVPGLFVAAVYSSSLSTISSGINAMACVTLEDFVRPVTDWRELTYTRMSRLLVFLYGLSYLAIAYLASEIGGLIRMAYGIHGILGGPITAVFLVGMLSTWINEWGALSGLFIGIFVNIWLFVGKTIYPPLPEYTRALPTTTEGCSENVLSSTSMSSNSSKQPWTRHYTHTTIESGINNNTITYSTPNADVTPTLTTSKGDTEDRPGIAEFYSISYLYAVLIGFVTTVLIAMIVSIATGKNDARPEKELLVPCLRGSDGDTEVLKEESVTKREGVERSASWFRPERYSVHRKDMDDLILQLSETPSMKEPFLGTSERKASGDNAADGSSL